MLPRRWQSAIPFLIFLLPLLVYLSCLNGVWAADHPTSFLDLDYAIFANHSFVIGRVGEYVVNSVDIFPHNGSYYSASAPGSAILAYPFVSLGFYLEGGFTVFGKVMLLSELFVALANSLAVFVLYRIGRDFFCSNRAAAFVALAYAFSTISWPFAEYFFQSDVSSLFVLLAVYFALKATQPRTEGTRISSTLVIFCGLSMGTAITVDYVDGILLLPIFGYLLLANRDSLLARLEGGMVFFLTSLIGVVLLLLYNYANFGDPFTSTEQLYLGSSGLLSGFSYSLPAGLVLNFLTPLRGLFLYSPVMAIGVIGFYKKLKPSSFDPRVLFLLTLFWGIVIPYSIWYGPTAGNSYGPRYLVPAMPLLLLPIGFVIDSARGRLGTIVPYAMFLIGVLVNGLGAFTGAVPPGQSWFTSPLLADAVPSLVHGQLDTWWISQAGALWPVPVAVIISAAALSPLLCNLGISVPKRRIHDAEQRFGPDGRARSLIDRHTVLSRALPASEWAMKSACLIKIQRQTNA